MVSHAVAMLDRSREHIRDRFDAAMRMPRKAGQVVVRYVVAEIIQEQKRIEIRRVAEAEGPAQMDACAFEGWLGLDQSLDGPKGHFGYLRSAFARCCVSVYILPIFLAIIASCFSYCLLFTANLLRM